VGAEPCGPSPRRPDKRTRCSTWGFRDGRAFRRGVRRFPSGSCAQPAIRATVVRLFGLCFGFCAPPIRTAHIAQSPVAVRSLGSAASSKPGGGAGRNRTAAGPAPEPPRERGNGNRTRPNPVRATYGLPARPIAPVQSRPVHLSSDSRLFVSYSIHAARVPPRFLVVTTRS
jgi:hypothetical protein